MGQARARAEEAGKGINIRYNIAKEGAIMFFDMLAIPADAPHPHNAHLFINYLLRPEVAAKNSAKMHYATSNAAAYPLVDADDYHDHGIYPTDAQKAHMYPNASHSIAYTRSSTASGRASRRVSDEPPTCLRRNRSSVSKRFGDFVAVDNVSLHIDARRDLLPARRLRLRQDHVAAHAGRLRDAERRAAADRRPGSGAGAALSSGRST